MKVVHFLLTNGSIMRQLKKRKIEIFHYIPMFLSSFVEKDLHSIPGHIEGSWASSNWDHHQIFLMNRALNDDASRKNQQQQLAQNMEKEISGLLKELESGQKALDEGVAMSRAMDSKFQNDVRHPISFELVTMENNLLYIGRTFSYGL